MKIGEILQEIQKGLSGKKLYLSAALACIYWAGAGKGWWPRDPLIDSAAGFAVLAALRAGSKTDAKRAVKEIKSDAADIAQKQEAQNS
jgi:hypothetical protein